MRTLNLGQKADYTGYVLLLILLLVWSLGHRLLVSADPTIGFIDPNIWLLLLLGLIAFLVTTALCWWLVQRFWMSLGLPALGNMVSQFRELPLWQQLGFYWGSFGLLLLAAVGVLMAIL